MKPDDQSSVLAFLSTPEAYGRPREVVDRIDTHISVVFLVGDRAYKLKRAVQFDYVDFSTLARRQAACEAEVCLNRRTAPALYLGVVPITRTADGALALRGRGTPIEWLVEMVRFDQATLFDRLAERQALDVGLMGTLAAAIARLHADAEPCSERGGLADMTWVVDGNARGFTEHGAPDLDAQVCQRLTVAARASVDRSARLLEDRRRRGFVRRCHGDLHLRNICLVGGVPTVFDAVEFNEQISCIDVWYDCAFLLMDLWRRNLRVHANTVFNEYVVRTGDIEGLGLLPLFLSCRAAVRAKTSAVGARVQATAGGRTDQMDAARRYLHLAEQLLDPPPPCLVAVGGWSGSGKTTLARRLAPLVGPTPGALILRSDVIRKELLHVDPRTRLGDDAYVPAVSRQVYQTMADCACAAVGAGHAVVTDAVYADESERTRIATVATDLGVPFVGLWLDGSPGVLERRLRLRVGDESDATADVLRLQIGRDPGPLDWHRVDGSRDAEDVQRQAEDVFRVCQVR